MGGKTVARRGYVISIIAAVLLILCIIGVTAVKLHNIDIVVVDRFFVDGSIQLQYHNAVPMWVDRVFPIMVILPVVALLISIIFIITGSGKKWRKVLLTVVIILVYLISGLIGIFVDSFYREKIKGFDGRDYSPQYYEFEDEGRRIVIRENCWELWASGATVFQINDDNRMLEIGSFSTEEYLNQGNYDLTWQDDGIVIGYQSDDGGTMREEFFRWIWRRQ